MSSRKQRKDRRKVAALSEVVSQFGGDSKRFAAPFVAANRRTEKRKREQMRRERGK